MTETSLEPDLACQREYSRRLHSGVVGDLSSGRARGFGPGTGQASSTIPAQPRPESPPPTNPRSSHYPNPPCQPAHLKATGQSRESSPGSASQKPEHQPPALSSQTRQTQARPPTSQQSQ